MILRLLFNTQMILMIFRNVLRDTIKIRNVKWGNSVDIEFSVRGKKLNICLVFITQSYFAVPKNIRLNSVHYFIMKILKKLQQIAFSHLSELTLKTLSVFAKNVLRTHTFLKLLMLLLYQIIHQVSEKIF